MSLLALLLPLEKLFPYTISTSPPLKELPLPRNSFTAGDKIVYFVLFTDISYNTYFANDSTTFVFIIHSA